MELRARRARDCLRRVPPANVREVAAPTCRLLCYVTNLVDQPRPSLIRPFRCVVRCHSLRDRKGDLAVEAPGRAQLPAADPDGGGGTTLGNPSHPSGEVARCRSLLPPVQHCRCQRRSPRPRRDRTTARLGARGPTTSRFPWTRPFAVCSLKSGNPWPRYPKPC